jgi:hypothetical protein
MADFIEDGITTKELDDIRAAQNVFIQSEGILRRREFIPPDDYDHRKTIGEHIPVRVSAGFGTFRDVADRFQGIIPFVLTFSWDQDVRADDELLLTDGRVFHLRATKLGLHLHTATQCLADLITDA